MWPVKRCHPRLAGKSSRSVLGLSVFELAGPPVAVVSSLEPLDLSEKKVYGQDVRLFTESL